MRKTERPAGRRFQLILIKPSHYDDDGYVVQWLRSAMPSNSLAAVFSLANGSASATILGPDFPIDVVRDRRDQHARQAAHITRRIAETAALGFVGIVGVQSNEFPRASTRPALRDAGVQVVIGGFHVSGCLSMLKEVPERHPEGAGSRHFDLRRRSRRAFRRDRSRRRAPRAESALQLHEAICRDSATFLRHPSCPTISSSARSAT